MTDRVEIAPLSMARGLWKRKLWLAATWIVATIAAVTVAYRLPAVYQAEAVILVELQGIPEKYVSSTVNADLQDRLNRISQQILSSTQLQGIIDRFGLYPEMRQTASPEDIFHKMRGDITISVENRTKDRPAAFRIACRGSQPQVVAQVVNHISSLLIEENGRSREVQAAGTSQLGFATGIRHSF